MQYIMFDVEESGRRVVAREVDEFGAQVPKSDGSVDGEPWEDIQWMHSGTPAASAFTVKFYKKGNPTNLHWPFRPPVLSGKSITLLPGAPVTTTLKSETGRWKYEVTVSEAGIKPLDPMIIIRGGSRSFAPAPLVFAAIGGFVVGALATCLFLS